MLWLIRLSSCVRTLHYGKQKSHVLNDRSLVHLDQLAVSVIEIEGLHTYYRQIWNNS